MSKALHSRCFFRRFKKICCELDIEVKNILKDTPFGHFLEMNDVSQDIALITWLLGRYNAKKNMFNLGGRKVPFDSEDTSLILGLTEAEMTVTMYGKWKGARTNIRETFFPGKKITSDSIETALKEHQFHGSTGRSDCAKLVILHLFCSFLFPDSNYAAPVALHKCADSLEGLNKYAWGSVVHELPASLMWPPKYKPMKESVTLMDVLLY